MTIHEMAKIMGISPMPVGSGEIATAVEILVKAAETIGQKAKERDVEKERAMARCVAIFNAATGLGMSELDGWLFMVCLKMARSKGGHVFNLDDYVDGSAYFALAGECADANDKFPL